MKLFSIVQAAQASPVMDLPRKFSFSYRSLVSREPGLWLLYQPYIKWDQMKASNDGQSPFERVICHDTQLIIDGFQGSANSFATAAFKASQENTVKLSHHLHSPSQIIQGVRKGIPVLLTIREPETTVLSFTKRWPHISVSQALRSYISFYKKLFPYQDSFVVSHFDDTINHLDSVLKRLNEKFNVSFTEIDMDEVNQKFRTKYNSKVRDIQTMDAKKAKREELLSAQNQSLLSDALGTYGLFRHVSYPYS